MKIVIYKIKKLKTKFKSEILEFAEFDDFFQFFSKIDANYHFQAFKKSDNNIFFIKPYMKNDEDKNNIYIGVVSKIFNRIQKDKINCYFNKSFLESLFNISYPLLDDDREQGFDDDFSQF